MMRPILLLSMLLLPAPADDDFVPKDVEKAVAVGCLVQGVTDSPPFAQAKVFVKYSKEGGWDWSAVISRREFGGGGTPKALDDCIDWLKKVRATLVKNVTSKDAR